MRRVVTLFEARGADQIRASLSTMRSGFGGLRGEMDRTGRSGNYVTAQLQALRTTLRYAFAGSAIFGTLQMVRNLGQFQAKLGEISAIASGPGGIPIVGQQLDQLGNDLLRISNETTQPVEDLQAGVISLYSTIGDIPENKAADMMSTISDVAITAQSNIEDTTQALLGMINAFGRGTDEIPKFGNEFYRVIRLSAGMPGHVYAQQLGRLSASAAIGQFSPEEMGGLAVAATRFGGSAAVNQRGLAQLMLYLMNPRGKEAQQTLAGIGLGPAQRQRLGGMGTLMKLLNEINRRGGVGLSRGLAGATDDTISSLEELGVTGQQAGIRGGGSALVSKATGRIESQRILAILSNLVTPAQVQGTKNLTIGEYVQQVRDGRDAADNFDKAMERAMDRRRILQAQTAIHNLGIETGNALAPWLQLPSRGITALTQGFGGQSGHVRQAEIVGGTVGIIALLRTLGRGGQVARGLPAVGAGLDALTQHQRGYSPLNPLYVFVVATTSGPGGVFSRGGGVTPTTVGQAETAATRAGRFSRVRTALARGPGRVFLGATGIAAAYEMQRALTQQQHENQQTLQSHTLLHYLRGKTGGLNAPGIASGPVSLLGRAIGHGPHPVSRTPAEQKILDSLKSGSISENEAERRLRAVATPQQLAHLGLKVTGQAHLTIDHTQDGAKVKRSHVTIDLFPDFTKPIGTTKGKNKSYRGGQ